ncbi:MAG: peptidylprolyl isomerase [Nitrospinae bacterium]|nr:peptidylprolyl isomerase [Nitrospinota bacterium]
MRSVQISHIVLTTNDLANVLLEHLKSYDDYDQMMKAFAKVAKKYSACSSRKQGGDLGPLEVHTSAPELYEAAMKAPVRKVQGPVKTRFGHHIFVLTEEDTMGDTGIDGITQPGMGAGDGTL